MNNTVIQIIAATGSTFAFGILYNLKGKKLICAAIGGAIGWIVYIYLKGKGSSDPGAFLFAAMAITIYAEIIARILKTPVTSTLIAALIPLVPGSGVYFTMSHFVQGETDLAIQKGIETILITVAITVGIVMISAFSEIYYKIKKYDLRKKALLKKLESEKKIKKSES
ncbi:threonine/serine exporter family protein [Fusobacterium sp.]|uniref:threonine/serine exporter family protein n=1 Tax=Fusobacterium sp. TaxID=68766 RepID=UPI00396C9559